MTTDIWAEIVGVPKPHRIVPFPRTNPKTKLPFCDVAIVMLTAEQSAIIKGSAEKKATKMLKETGSVATRGYDELYKDFCAVGVLFNSVRKASDISEHFFPSDSAILSALTVDEIAVLLNHYYLVSAELGPIIGEMSQEEMDAYVKRMQESGSQSKFFLSGFSLVALTDLILHLVSLLPLSPTDRSSPGTLPEKSISAEELTTKSPAKN